jgi:hypothetical protein
MHRTAELTENTRLPVRGILFDIALNAIIPLILYRLSKRFISPSQLTALAIAALFLKAFSIFCFMGKSTRFPSSHCSASLRAASRFCLPVIR